MNAGLGVFNVEPEAVGAVLREQKFGTKIRCL